MKISIHYAEIAKSGQRWGQQTIDLLSYIRFLIQHDVQAGPSATTAAPSEVKQPLKEPAKPPVEAANLRTGDTNGIKSLEAPVEVPASSVETTVKEGTEGSTVPKGPEAPRSVAREKLAYLLRK